MDITILVVLGLLLTLLGILSGIYVVQCHRSSALLYISLILVLLCVIPCLITVHSTNEKVYVDKYELVPIGNTFIVENPNNRSESLIYYYKDDTVESKVIDGEITVQSTYDENYIKIVTTRKTWWYFYTEKKAYIINIMNGIER